MWLLYTAAAQVSSVLPEALNEVNEVGIWTILVSVSAWAFRVWWKSRVEKKQTKQLEEKLENDIGSSLAGSSNPGRSLPQMLESIYEDLQTYKMETNGTLLKVHEDLGKIKGKLGLE